MKTSPNIEKIIYEYILETFLPHNSNQTISFDKDLYQSGIVDSAGLISFLCFIEKEFSITIPDEDLLPQNFCSIETITDYIRVQLSKTSIEVLGGL